MDRVRDEVYEMFATPASVEAPTRAEVRSWLEEVLAFWERHRALIDANHQAMPVEERVAQQWWKGFEEVAATLPMLERQPPAELASASACGSSRRSSDSSRAPAGSSSCARSRSTVELLLDALTEDWYALRTARRTTARADLFGLIAGH